MLASLIIAARSRFGLVQRCVELILALLAAVLCWSGVSWALQPGLILMMDELGNLTRFLDAPYWQLITLFPQSFYNDRPVGLAFERLLFDGFGFNYAAQLSCYLVIHFTNCGLVFLLFRRLGVGVH